MATKPVPATSPSRSNSLDAGGAVLRALARSPHYNENLHHLDEIQPVPPLDLNAQVDTGSLYHLLVVKWEIPRKIFHATPGFVVLWLYWSRTDLDKIVQVLFYMFLFISTADLLRLNSVGFEHIYESVLGVFMRSAEKERVNGVIWYLIGVMVSLRLFPEDIASVSIVILSWCDPCASTFGRLFGKRTPSLPSPLFARRKSLAGFVAATIMGSFVAYLFWGTSIAQHGERPSGLSWTPGGHARFGTSLMPDELRTGWRGFSRGFASADANLGERMKGLLQPQAPAIPPMAMYISCGLIAGVTEALEMGGLDDNISIPILSAFLIWMMLWVWGLMSTA